MEVAKETEAARDKEAQAVIKAVGDMRAILPAQASIKGNAAEAMMKEAVAVVAQEVPVASLQNPNNPRFRYPQLNQAHKLIWCPTTTSSRSKIKA